MSASRTPVISLGAGVQSSVMLLMAADGAFDVMPRLAVFADPQGELPEVYSWLGYLRRTAGERIEIVDGTAGNLYDDVIDAAAGGSTRASQPPLFTVNPDGSHGFSPRKCTRDYKVRVVRRVAREHGYGPQRPIEAWLGISTDETERIKPSDVAWAQNCWPLIDAGMSRADCERWLSENGHPPAPKSACFFCPFQSDARWRRLRDEWPVEWQRAIELDRAVRHLPGMKGEGYLHRQRVPLDQVDLSTPEDRGQLALGEGFGGECEGMCGV